MEIMKELRLEEVKGCATPAEDRMRSGPSDDDAETGTEEAEQYRSLAARANYLGLDRPDVQFTSRALCKRMSKPTKGDFEHRLGRYLRSHPRAIWSFPWQHDVPEVIVRTDSDWTGDKRDRASVSGGMLMIGSHLIRSWSKDQDGAAARSSSEAELDAANKGLGCAAESVSGVGRKRDEGHPET